MTRWETKVALSQQEVQAIEGFELVRVQLQ